jgi:catechol 2,3-dioxygenase-like lactoylglutathione lyase family enzyme
MFKRVLVTIGVLVVACVTMVAHVTVEKAKAAEAVCNDAKPLATRDMVHIAIIVRDVEKAAKEWADLFAMEVPKWSLSDPPEKSNVRYRGKPTEARLKTAFLKLDNLRIEIMEPVGGPSTWMEFLKTRGEGVHHVAFRIKGMDEQAANIEKMGMPLIQRGEWTAYTGGAYAYFDSPQLGVILELLENY